jgi:hypothetical protein
MANKIAGESQEIQRNVYPRTQLANPISFHLQQLLTNIHQLALHSTPQLKKRPLLIVSLSQTLKQVIKNKDHQIRYSR